MTEETPQPHPPIKDITFDYDDPDHPTHFLDHHWWEKSRCEDFQKWPRGLRVHWRYWNEFKKESDFEWLYRLYYCRLLKRHRLTVMWKYANGKPVSHQKVCWHCDYRESEFSWTPPPGSPWLDS